MNFFTITELAKRKNMLAPADEFVEKMSSGLMSREGAAGFAKFKTALAQKTDAVFSHWNEAVTNNDFTKFTGFFAYFLRRVLSCDIGDSSFPAHRGVGIMKSHFPQAAMSLSLAEFLCQEDKASELLQHLVTVSPDTIYLQTALAKALLNEKKYRAADAALVARRIATYDYTASRILNDAQKALKINGLQPDYPLSIPDPANRFCEVPFLQRKLTRAYTSATSIGATFCYCGTWLPLVLEGESALWNSPEMQDVRQSILDGSFKYCDECRCPLLQQGTLPYKHEVSDAYLRDIIDNNLVILPKGPSKIMLDYDYSCNISCPSCRPEVCMMDAKTAAIMDEKIERELSTILPDVEWLILSQAGEALASPHSLRILKSLTPEKYPELKVEIFTNLSLVSPKKWKSLGTSAQCIKRLFMSIDGGTKPTLEKLRRGLTWERMLDALDFVRTLRKDGMLEYTSIGFVLQYDNYKEFKEILELASTYCVDLLMITKIMSNGSYGLEEFENVNVGDAAHPEFAAYTAAAEELQAVYKKMQDDRETVLAAGKSVPELVLRLF